MSKHLLSICIPTNGVAKWVIPTVQNIYELGADENLFEVVVADNGGDSSDLPNAINIFLSHKNFRYIPTKAKGFYNIIENFTLAHGDYMIKLNHRCILHKGMIEYIYNQAEKYYERKPLMFFLNGNMGFNEVREYSNFNDFLYDFSYMSSLSEGLFFWKDDIQRVPKIKFAPMSPNVSLMFDSRYKTLFVLDGTIICHDQNPKGKYGYALFKTFAVLYMDLINEVRIDGSITNQTFLKIKKDIYNFLCKCYVSMKVDGALENYTLDDMEESLSIYYTKREYYKLYYKVKYFIFPIMIVVKKIFRVIKFLRESVT
ncbi:MAG: hypothetical protein J5534_03630 [Fibrobacter sp.]|nr:hypothetical protein [Fibrobacter sp.]